MPPPMHTPDGKVQTVLIPRQDFTLQEAYDWLEDHHFGHRKVDITDDYFRFRQIQPIHGGRYVTKTLPNGIEIVIHYP
jgi:hypothetical protein